jgi:hypothetical protein
MYVEWTAIDGTIEMTPNYHLGDSNVLHEMGLSGCPVYAEVHTLAGGGFGWFVYAMDDNDRGAVMLVDGETRRIDGAKLAAGMILAALQIT